MPDPTSPPLPTIGELLHQFCFAFSDLGELGASRDDGERRRRDTLRRRLVRVAKGGDMDARECHAIIVGQLAPLKAASPLFGERLAEWACKGIDYYRSLIPELEFAGLSRGQAMPLLAEHIFLPFAAILLRGLEVGGEDFPARSWANEGAPATALTLDWWLGRRGLSQCEFGKEIHGLRRKTRPGLHLPTILSNLSSWLQGRPMDILSVLEFHDGTNDRLADCLLVARAFRKFWDAVPEGDRERLRQVWRARVLAPGEGVGLDLLERQVKAVALADERVLEFAKVVKGNAEMAELTGPHTVKRGGDMFRTAALLDRVEAANPLPDLGWLITLERARHNVLKGCHDQAAEFYEKAFEGARYRSGPMAKAILNELAILTAFMGRKSDGKGWAVWAEAMGLTLAVRDPASAYSATFPLESHYPEADVEGIRKAIAEMPGRYFADEAKWSAERPDYRNMERRRKGFGSIPKTQLMIHAARGDAKRVEALIARGADVNAPADDNSSVLLKALDSGSQECVDLILPRCVPETLNRVTKSKGGSALWIAIERGDPELVSKLIASGADVNVGYGEMRVSPLYDAVRRCSEVRPAMAHMLTDAAVRSALKYAFPNAFVDSHAFLEDQVETQRRMFLRLMADPRNRAIFEAVVERQFAAADPQARLKVVSALLGGGAAPNRPESYWHGFTPFLVSAEGGDIPVFETLRSAGGDFWSETENGQSALWLAVSTRRWPMALHILSVASAAEAAFLLARPETVHGTTALHRLVLEMDESSFALEVLDAMIASGVDVGARTVRGHTALMLAEGGRARTPNTVRALERLRRTQGRAGRR